MSAQVDATKDSVAKVGRFAAETLVARSEPLFAIMGSPDAISDAAALAGLYASASDLRESLRLFSPLYPRVDGELWSRRLRKVTRSVAAVVETSAFLASLRAASGRMSDGGKRATAFYVGYLGATNDYEAAALAKSIASLGLTTRESAFRAFARAPKKGSAAKVALRSFAAAVIGDAVASLYDQVPAVLADGDSSAQRAVGKSLRRLASAVSTLSQCYSDEELLAAEKLLTALRAPFDKLRDAQVAVDVVRDRELVVRARAAGVLAANVDEVAAVFERRAARLAVDARRAIVRHAEATVRATLLDPLVPVAPEPKPAAKPARKAAPKPPAAG
jgi:hypothetical protein